MAVKKISNDLIAVVIPCYKVKRHVLDVISGIGPEVWRIYAVDDCCPEESGEFIKINCRDRRVVVLKNSENKGVGGAVIRGYTEAIKDGASIIVKIDGDGQMDPSLISYLTAPILAGEADYTKGNRFYYLEEIRSMPKVRLFGNAVLSFMTKLSSGYWNLFDPTNGFTAIHTYVAKNLPLTKISNRYFFETDILFRLNTIRAVVVDIPMHAKYGDEESNLKISLIIGEFLIKHCRNLIKRIFYNYYLRDMSIASIELPVGITMFLFGVIFGCYKWFSSIVGIQAATAGTVMLSALPSIFGFQLLLAFLQYDIVSIPNKPIHPFKEKKNNAR